MLPLVFFLLEIFVVHAKAKNTSVPAVIVFGDSVVDPGNNNALVTLIKCNFPPYGKDFKDHKATGRFSNGRIPSDFIVSKYGLKRYLPAYLGTELDDHDLLTGVSFASGGSGYDPLTSKIVQTISMDDQLDMFKKYKTKLISIAGKEKAKVIISKSLYVVIAGTDDLANTYFTTIFRRNYDLHSYIQFVVQSASKFFQELHKLGARRIRVTGIPPIGCLPSQRTIAGGFKRECNARYNQAARTLSTELAKELRRLNHTLQGSKMVFIDMYTPMMNMIKNPSKYGFEEVKRGCCGTGLFESIFACNGITAWPCKDPSKYLFWDAYHPTERAYKILMKWVFQRYPS